MNHVELNFGITCMVLRLETLPYTFSKIIPCTFCLHILNFNSRSVDGAQLELQKMSGSLGNMWLNWEVKLPNRTEPFEIVVEATIRKPGKGDIAIDDVVFDKNCVYYDGPYTTPMTSTSTTPKSTPESTSKSTPESTSKSTPESSSSTSQKTSTTSQRPPMTSTSVRTSTTTTIEETEGDGDDNSEKTTIVAVIIAGCVLLVLILGAVAYTVTKRRRM